MSKKIMGSSFFAPKQLIREMAQNGYIEDVSFWLKSIDQKNLSPYTYNEILADEVYYFTQSFLSKALDLLDKLKSI